MSLLLVLLATLFVTILATAWWSWRRWQRARSYWRVRGVPHTPPHPVWGSLTFFMKKNVGEWIRELYAEYEGEPYVGIWWFWRPALVVNCPQLARRILVKDAYNFRDRLLSSGSTDPIGSLNIFTINDPQWSEVRRHLTPTFTSAKLKSFAPLFATKAKELAQRIRTEAAKNKKFDIKTVLADYTTDLIGIATFSVESNATLTGDSNMRRVTKDFQKYSTWRGLAWTSIFFMPEIVDVFRFTLFPRSATDYFTRVFRSVVSQRGGYTRPVPSHGDLIDALVRMKQEAANKNEDIDEQVLVAQAAIMVQGGFDTSASALTFCLYELAFAHDAQERLYQELKEAKEKIGGADLDMATLADLPYLNAVWKEVVRMYPAMGWLDRIPAEDYKLDDKLTIPAGTPIYVNAIGMQSDPKYFPNPKKFQPERFLPENESNIVPFTYLPFGDGPRVCIGARFAHQVMRHALAALILEFELQPVPGEPEPKDCEIEKKRNVPIAGAGFLHTIRA